MSSGVDGTGQAIAIIAPGNYLDTDLQAYWTNNGVTRSLSSIAARNTRPAASPDTEATLDIELASAMAPGSPVYVYFSGLDATTILAALGRAAEDAQAMNPTADGSAGRPFLSTLSMSFSACDAFLSQAEVRAWETLFSALVAGGVTIFAASGDNGVAGCSTGTAVLNIASAGFPAVSPLVTAVGGTALTTDAAGNRQQEIAWAKTAPFTLASSGGGKSRVFVRPPWQSGLSLLPDNARLVPDVSLTASTVDFYMNGLDLPSGGTSASSPLWAAIIALINHHRVRAGTVRSPVGFLNAKFYELGATSIFRDISDGRVNDWIDGAGNILVPGYPAGPGYDLVTGWGVPDVQALDGALLNLPQQTPGTAAIVSGNNQAGAAGSALAQPFVVSVRASDGSPVANFTVLFHDPLGGFYSAQTDAGGQASLTYAVPAGICREGVTVCTFQVLAIASGFLNSPLAFTVNPAGATPAQIRKVSGDNQRTPVNTAFPFPLKVQVTDAIGNGLANVALSFSGPGVATASVQTDANGMAATNLNAGSGAGAVQVTASAGALSATFNETIVGTVTGADLQVSTPQISLTSQVNRAVAQTFAVANVGDLGVRVVAAAAPSTAFMLTGTKADGTCDYLTISAGLALTARVTTLCVIGNPSGTLAAGDYSGNVSVTGESGVNATATVGLSLRVTPITAPPEISVSPAALNITVLAGTNPSTQTVAVNNAGGGLLNWTASVGPGATWLSVTPLSGAQGQSFVVTITSAALAQGNYGAVITVRAPPALPRDLTVQLSVVSTAPRMSLTSGNGQTGLVGAQLASPLVVTLADAALAGIPVTFAISGTPEGAAGQTVTATSVTTAANGQASTSLTLGSRAGTYAVTASSTAPSAHRLFSRRLPRCRRAFRQRPPWGLPIPVSSSIRL